MWTKLEVYKGVTYWYREAHEVVPEGTYRLYRATDGKYPEGAFGYMSLEKLKASSDIEVDFSKFNIHS